jgi:hypothetical protein
VTRVVVAGPYPPTADPVATEVLDEVRALRRTGATVLVVSPQPSAAPVTADPTTRAGRAHLARLVVGADRFCWYAPPGARPSGRLARALLRVPEVVVHPVAAQAPPRPGPGARLRRVRAGLPTWVRGVGRGWRSA